MDAHIRFMWMTVFISVASIKLQTAERQKFGENYIANGNDMHKNTKLCFTQECIKTAARFVENLDVRADPCEDFFQFSCGGFAQRHLTGASVSTLLNARIKAQLRKLLLEPKSLLEPKAIHKIKDFFRSCLNEDRQKAVGIEPLNRYIADHGGWPVVLGEKWDEASFNWQDASSAFVKDGIGKASLISSTCIPNYQFFHIPETFLIAVSDRSHYDKKTIQSIDSAYGKAQYNLMVGIANYLGAPKETAEKELREVMEFIEEGFPGVKAKALTSTEYDEYFMSGSDSLPYLQRPESVSSEGVNVDPEIIAAYDDYFMSGNDSLPCLPRPTSASREDTKHRPRLITVADLYPITDQVDWLSFFRKIYSLDISMDTKVIHDLQYPAYWADRIKNLTGRDSKRLIANYFMWLGIHQFIGGIDDPEINKLKEEYEKSEKESKWKKCLKESDSYFIQGLTWLYSNKYFTAGEKEGVTDMFNQIRVEFGKALKKVKWLTNETLYKAKEKLSTFKSKIAYPQKLMDAGFLDHHYKSLEIDSDKYFENTVQIMKFKTNKETAMIGKNITNAYWHDLESILDPNAFYYYPINAVVIPAAQIQDMYYAPNRPMALNYGGLGSIVGHEFMHGFNEIGASYNYPSELIWWKPEDLETFRKRTKCVTEQYGKFGHPKTGQLNSRWTLDENLADNTGILYSYRAYQHWLKENGDEALLPGMDQFSPNQMFWLAFANALCAASYDTHYYNTSEYYYSHSPSEFRVHGTVANIEEFSKDFQCPLGSAMNPPTKCSVW